MGRDELALLQWKDVCTWSTFMDEETGLWRTEVLRLLRVTQLRSGRRWDLCSSPHQACDPQSSATVGQIRGELEGPMEGGFEPHQLSLFTVPALVAF